MIPDTSDAVVRRAILFLVVGAIVQVSTAEARTTGRARSGEEVDTIVIHSVGGPACIGGKITFREIQEQEDDAAHWKKIIQAAPEADAHFVVGRGGTVEEVIPVLEVANHTVGLNRNSIGIELVNRGDGKDPYPDRQINALVELIRKLRARFNNIAIERIVRHSDADRRTCTCSGETYFRRQDPGANFPFESVLRSVATTGESVTRISFRGLEGAAHGKSCPID